jgi:hypothetical protein
MQAAEKKIADIKDKVSTGMGTISILAALRM